MARLLQLDQLFDRKVDLLLGHVAFIAVLDQVGALEAECGVHDADRGDVEDRGLSLVFRIEQILPLGHRMIDEVGAVADGVGVVDLRQEGRPLRDALVQVGRIRLVDVHRLVGRDALARDQLPIEFTLGEDRQEIVEFLDLLDIDALDHAALGREFGLPALEIGDIDSVRLRDEAIDRGRGVNVLHRDLEAEILGSLIADRLHHRVGHADVAKLDVLYFLRPYDGSADHARSRCRARGSRRGL